MTIKRYSLTSATSWRGSLFSLQKKHAEYENSN